MKRRNNQQLILAIDVQYGETRALACGLGFPAWESSSIQEVFLKSIDDVAPYVSGSFYLRELPCILALLAEVKGEIEAIVIDGFVTLGAEGNDGLGMHLYNAIGRTVPVV